MIREAARSRPEESSEPSRRESGTRFAIREETAPESGFAAVWAKVADQDSIPTEPANEQPKAPTLPAPALEAYEPAIEIPPPSHREEARDTIPSPPPERE